MSTATTQLFSLAVLTILIVASGSAVASDNTVGLITYESGTYGGYTLFNPTFSTFTYLIDEFGRVVHTWESDYSPSLSVYLLESGNLLRSVKFGEDCGGVQLMNWDGDVIWEYEHCGANYTQHHDIEMLPNGNVLLLARELKTQLECTAAGRDPLLLDEGELTPEYVIEVMPTGPTTGEIVWEWYVWDHLIQEYDSTKENFGIVREHPELVDINFVKHSRADWIHANSVAYNPDLDQIVISSRTLGEIWVIDHSTTTAEAAGHTGGNSGKGGDILYRWGNPRSYQSGTLDDQQFFNQHDAHWIEPGLPGAGNILVFNNGDRQLGRDFSTVDEIVTPIDLNGHYLRAPGQPFEPETPLWSYIADNPTDLSAFRTSSAQRLANGNTIICAGPDGWFFEVTPEKQIVWEYINPATSKGMTAQGEIPGGNGTFRCYRYPADYPGLLGRVLEPAGTLELYPVEIAGTAHYPSSPTSIQSIYITSLIQADSGLAIAELYVDTGDGFVATAMFDDGAHNDGDAGDGLFGSIIGMLPGETVVSYYIRCEDDSGHVNYDPSIVPELVYTFNVSSAELVIGDPDGSGEVDIDDVVFLVGYIFGGGEAPNPISAGDANCSGEVDIDDIVYLVNYIFSGGFEPGDPDGNGEPDC